MRDPVSKGVYSVNSNMQGAQLPLAWANVDPSGVRAGSRTGGRARVRAGVLTLFCFTLFQRSGVKAWILQAGGISRTIIIIHCPAKTAVAGV